MLLVDDPASPPFRCSLPVAPPRQRGGLGGSASWSCDRSVPANRATASQRDTMIPEDGRVEPASSSGHHLVYGRAPQQSAATEMRLSHPRPDLGLTIFFTRLSGAGKSTIADSLRTNLLERESPAARHVTLSDGDLMRKYRSSASAGLIGIATCFAPAGWRRRSLSTAASPST